MNRILHNIKLLFLLSVVIGLAACSAKPTANPASGSGENPQATATLPPAPIPLKVETLQSPDATATPAKPAAENPSSESSSETIRQDILLDPALAQDADSLKINALLYEGLVKNGPDGKVEPAIAESWVVSEDQLDYIFKIRVDARFSDGTPVTTDIIEANFNRWFDPKNSLHGNGDYAAWKRYFLAFLGEKDSKNRAKSPIDGIQKVDQRTVLVHLNRPVPELLKSLCDPAFSILSIQALKAGSYGTIQSPVVSSGPYLVESWGEGVLTLGPNPNYWGEIPQGKMSFRFK